MQKLLPFHFPPASSIAKDTKVNLNKRQGGRKNKTASSFQTRSTFTIQWMFMPRTSFSGSLQMHPPLLKWPLHAIGKDLPQRIRDTRYISQKQMPPHHVNVSRQIFWKECWRAESGPVAPQHETRFQSSSHVPLILKDYSYFSCLVWILPGVWTTDNP